MLEKISAYYEKDHDRLDDLFKNFQKWKREDFPRAREFFVSFKFGLQRHIIWEEEVLFPLFEDKTGAIDGPTEVMRLEHRQIGETLEEIHKKVQQRDPNSDSEERLLLNVLSLHNIKEESILYPAIDRMVTDREIAEVYEAMKNIPEERYQNCCRTA